EHKVLNICTCIPGARCVVEGIKRLSSGRGHQSPEILVLSEKFKNWFEKNATIKLGGVEGLLPGLSLSSSSFAEYFECKFCDDHFRRRFSNDAISTISTFNDKWTFWPIFGSLSVDDASSSIFAFLE
uniref:Uncharacterized protein n=1 Tax=Romanomermis culicivorax TaxID=13658 RepID=A0A915IWH7_ROMCU